MADPSMSMDSEEHRGNVALSLIALRDRLYADLRTSERAALATAVDIIASEAERRRQAGPWERVSGDPGKPF